MKDYESMSVAELNKLLGEEPKNTRTIGGEIARAGAIGPASLLDIPPFLGNLPFYAGSGIAKLAGYGEGKPLIEPFGYPSEYVRKGVEKLSGVEGQPKTFGQQAIGTGTEFLTGGGTGAALSKLPGLAKLAKISPENIKDYLKIGGAGAASGGVQQQTDNPLLAAIASVVPQGLQGIGRAAKNVLPSSPTNRAVNNLNQNIGHDVEKSLVNQQKAEKYGLNLTPAEATGNPLLAAEQGSLGTSKEGALKLYEDQKSQIKQQKNIINDFLNEVNPDQKLINEEARTLAGNIIGNKEQELINKARPFYDKSEKLLLDSDKFGKIISKDPTIKDAVDDVLSKSLYAAELEGFEPNSIKVLDLAKKNIDSKISVAKRAGDKETVRLLNNSKNRLVSELDKVSPDYKKARAIYEEDSPAIQAIRDSAIGKIANMNDEQLKGLSKTIFDPTVKDPKRINMYRDEIYKESPEIWNALIRNDMESRLSKGEVTGSKFYKNILQDENLYRHYQSALKNNPQALEALHDFKDLFGNLIGHKTAKTSAAQAKSSLDVPRSTLQAGLQIADNLTGGKYDNAAIDLIIGGKWHEKLKRISKSKDPIFKRNQLLGVLESINKEGQSKKTQESNQSPERDFESMSIEELNQLLGE